MTNDISIVVKSDANEVEKFSAKELADYLIAITGKQIHITNELSEGSIYVGCFPEKITPNELESLHNDSFIIRDIGQNIIIYGKTPRGTLYGIYDYLQKLGVRWYFPGKENEFVPKRDDVFLKGIDVKESPDMNHRSVVIYHWEDGFQDWIDFAAKTKLNAIHIHSNEGIDLMPDLVASRGLDFNIRRHFFGDKYSHGDNDDLEKNKALATNYVSKLPSQISDFFLWPADVVLLLSDKAEDWSIPDVILSFTNEMSTAICKIRPNARMSFLAYWSTWGVPKKVQPIESVFLELAHIQQCYSHSIADPECPVNSKEIPPVIDGLLEIFDPSETHVLGYWLDASLFGRGVYQELSGRLPIAGSLIQQDIKYYKSKGVTNISTFAVYLDKKYFSRFASPSVFQYPALLWNVDADLDSELLAFCENFYGDRSLQEIFAYTEHIDPIHNSPEQWNDLIQHISRSEMIVRDVIKNTSNDVHILRLEKLLKEMDHLNKWVSKYF
jgi:hypothetical protein